jgi:Flp pilus assembly protein TadD
MASLELRVKRYNQAIEVAERCTKLEPNYADAWLILGVAQREKGLKAEARTSLEKAKELGDKRAEEYLKNL